MLAHDHSSSVRDTLGMNSDANGAPVVTRHDDHNRYDLTVGSEVVAFADFFPAADMITIPYIETAIHHRGNDYSAVLMDGVADDLRARGMRVRATCSVARAHLAERAADLLVH
jgi:predicted GNAT family acetyltransferase